MIFFTRFDNSFKEASPFGAARELVGMMLFDFNVRNANAFSENLFWGQAPVLRWRKLNLTAFDPCYALIALLATGYCLYCFVARLSGRHGPSENNPDNILIKALFLWSITCATGLGAFYLYYPVMASRYLFDFAPALTGFTLMLWVSLKRWNQVLWPILAMWLVCEIAIAKVSPEFSRSKHIASAERGLSKEQDVTLQKFDGLYDATQRPEASKMTWNGHGWDQNDGVAQNIVILAIDQPEFVELTLSKRRVFNGKPAPSDVYRALIDGVSLPVRSVTNSDDAMKVVFDVPPSLKTQMKDQVLFLCFSKNYDVEDRISERMLYSVRWKK